MGCREESDTTDLGLLSPCPLLSHSPALNTAVLGPSHLGTNAFVQPEPGLGGGKIPDKQ